MTAELPGKQAVLPNILDNKNQYISSKKRQEIEELQEALKKEKQRARQKQDDHKKIMIDLQEKQSEEIKQIEKSHKQQIELITNENDKILSAAL